ncbi:MAG: hypothetical protein ACYSWS_06170 [Planctomycetota bacterium]
MTKREEGMNYNSRMQVAASKESAQVLCLGEKVPHEIFESLKATIPPLDFSVALDGTLMLTVFGDKVNEQTKLTRVGLYSTDIFPYCLIGWYFESLVSRLYPTFFNIKRELNVSKFLSSPKNKIGLAVTYVNSEGILLKLDIIRNPDFVSALQRIWNKPLLDWSVYDNKIHEFSKLLKEGSISLGEGIEWFEW